jgi:2-polyprenyl-6-methoxyphenol hydroxylase-like FAD-dependent oxidoreductase
MTQDGQVEISTSKGAKVLADVLVAADGSSSKLRALLRPNDGLKFAGPTCIYGTTDLSHAPSGRANEFGSVVSGKGPALFVAPVDKKSMVWCLSWHVEEPPTPKKQPMPKVDAEVLLKEAREIGEPPYGKRFADMLDATHYSTVNKFNAMDKQSFAHTAPYIHAAGLEGLNKRVIFLGDANHAVSPFAGNGANLALMDGWDFAESLVVCGSMQEALRRYDALAVGRARQVVRISHLSVMVMHSTG